MLFPKNKKAQEGISSDETESSIPAEKIMWGILFIIFISFVFILSLIGVNAFFVSKTYVPDALRDYALREKFASECFVKFDTFQNALSHTIDSSRFTTEQLQNCYPATAKDAAVRLTLNGLDAKSIQSVNWNERRSFDKQLSPIEVKVYGDTSSFRRRTLTLEVQYAKKSVS